MTTRYLFPRDTLCSSGVTVSISSLSAVGDDRMAVVSRNRHPRVLPSSFLVRLAMRASRTRWFSFLRRVFHYQNGSRTDLRSNPFNSGTWMVTELAALVVQIILTTYTLSNSMEERPLWPMRMWVSGYDFGCVLNLFLLNWRYRLLHQTQAIDGFSFSGNEQQRSNEEPRSLPLMNKFQTCLELFFAIWFVMGNVWMFGSHIGSFRRAPKLHLLCMSVLAWNAIGYSFPFILFLLLCCCVPLISNLLGYNMNMGSIDRGASDEQLSDLPSWNYKEVSQDVELGKSIIDNEKPECCICLAKYREKEEIRQLPCSHTFHLKCVDQWLKIISCCPLCKQELVK